LGGRVSASLRKRVLAKGTRILDILVMVTTFSAALYLHAPNPTPWDLIGFFSLKIKLINILAVFILIIAWNQLFAYFGLYERRRLDNRFREWLDIIKAVTISVLFLSSLTFFLSDTHLDKKVLFTFWLGCIFSTITGRSLVRAFLIRLRNRGRNLRYIVFIGSGRRAVDWAKKILGRHELGYRLVGFIDDDYADSAIHDIPKVRRLCSLHEFQNYLESHVVDEVFIALPVKSYYEQIRLIADQCQELGILCRVPANWFEFKVARTVAYELEGEPVLTIYSGSKKQWELLWAKRAMDIFFATFALFILMPLYGVIALLIKTSSSGPVFFKQDRVGYNRRRFQIIKFRTMVPDAEKMQTALEALNESDGPTFKIHNDPRITPVGRWLRRTSLDEIPQLINVLKGEMSLVGPRPLPLRDVAGIDENWQKRRFSMRPGLTCLWQINGRNQLRFYDWMRLDLQYIDHWSVMLDVKILLKTLPVFIRADGQ
jgi:exopolysaccharide biosynthesis polyprenyl glycosylphosphotransferase